MMTNQESEKLEYLLTAYNELRDEVKMRIQQRDNLAIQLIVSIGVLAGIAVTDYQLSKFAILLIPILNLYFTIQIFGSYEVHDRLVKFIRENIEANIGKILQIENSELPNYFWEQHCKNKRELQSIKNTGGRKFFFEVTLLLVPILCFVAFIVTGNSTISEFAIGITTLLIYEVIGGKCVYKYGNKHKLNELSARDYKKPFSRKKNLQKAVFFDRDGTLHVDKVETTLEKGLVLFPDSKKVITELKKRGYLIVIITNQSGIAKGHITLDQMHKFNKALRKALGGVHAIYYCPHKHAGGCRCSKPNTGMIERAVKELNIDLSKSFLVGDKIGDIKAAQNAGIPAKNRFLVTTGIYENNDYKTEPDLEELSPVVIKKLSKILSFMK